jgi:F0F1-type ATP synthase membrane subunit b/b'
MSKSTKFAFFSFFVPAIALTSVAHADYISDQIAKAEQRIESAEKNLQKWRDCEANRDECIATLRAKAEKSAERANARLAELNTKTAD